MLKGCMLGLVVAASAQFTGKDSDQWAVSQQYHGVQEDLCIYDSISARPDMVPFVEALETDPDFKAMLKSKGNFTFFHPTPAAIEHWFAYFEIQGKPLSFGYLLSTLKYHFLNETKFSTDFDFGLNVQDTMMNDSAFVNYGNKGQQKILVNKRKHFHPSVSLKINFGIPGWKKTTTEVIAKDICCKNGVVHMIDKVMWFPRFASETMTDGQAHAMRSALSTAQLMSKADTTSNITIFLPLNQALEKVLGGGDNVDPGELEDLLLTYMANGGYFSPSLVPGTSITMMNKKVLPVHAHTGGSISVGGSKVLLPNILLRNGVLHVIEHLVTPAKGLSADKQ